MVHIPQFRQRWEFYRPRAHRISSHFNAGERITQDVVAQRIPHDPDAPLPADGENGIAGAAFGNWLATETLPDNRRRQWEELTRVPVAIWTVDLAGFERGVRQKAGEILGWQGLVQTRAARGGIRIRVEDPAREARQSADLRFYQDGIDPDERSRDVQLVWPNCIARIYVPVPAPKGDAEDRRAWLLADYGGAKIFMLDPAQPASGAAPSSRIDRAFWRPDGRDGHVVLPRGTPGHVWLPPSIALGTRFDVLVLMLNLGTESDEIRALFDAMERRWLASGREVLTPSHQAMLRSTLDEAAALIDTHGIRHVLHVQPCEVVDRATALGAAHG